MCDDVAVFDKFILESAEMYLQTVVLIDDKIYVRASGVVASHLAAPSSISRKPALRNVTVTPKEDKTLVKKDEIAVRPEEVSFHEVQNSFAKKRIICSLYQPKKDASFGDRSEVCILCSAADVVIVDWDIYGDPGTKATELVKNLIAQSMRDVPHQLRLILLYTLEINLGKVANDVFESLRERIGDDAITVENGSEGLVLTTNNARVVVLGKREIPTLPQYASYFVPERDLAKRTIEEFSKLASGLLQGIVLRGIAHLRENNRRILMRFHDDLDASFLAHRALLLPDEAFAQIIPLLTDELRAVLEDSLGDSPIGTGPMVERTIRGWLDRYWKPGRDPKLELGAGVDASVFAKDVFCNGPELQNDYSRARKSDVPGLINKIGNAPPTWKEAGAMKVAEYLSTDSTGVYCQEKLSSLMSQRIAYENARRALHLGVVLKEMNGEQRYLLCLQPVCDSIRISGKARAFVFCVMTAADANGSFTHAVVDLKGNLIRLKYRPKPSDCYTTSFRTQSNELCAVEEDGRHIYEDINSKKFEWVAELKTDHAQRSAEEFGRALSRVGLTESEWLRLKAKKCQ